MLSFQTAGHKIPFVLVHAWPLSSQMWVRQLDALKNRVMLITPDIPGLGKSNRQKVPSIPEIAKEVAGLLDSLQVKEPVIIGGLSMGGYVTFEFFRQYPDRVRGICLLATRANSDTPEIRQRRFDNIQFLERYAKDQFLPRVIPKLLGKSILASDSEVPEEVKDMILKNSAEGICDTLRAMAARQDSTDLLKKIQCPTLVIAGDEDAFVTVEESEAMYSKIAGAEFYVMKNTGHLLNLENPETFNRVIADFIDRRF